MVRQIHIEALNIAALLLGLAMSAVPALAGGLPSPVVTDPLTGVALDGNDPVSYFTEPSPLPGKPDFEYDWGGVPWYFANAANRDVFIRAPQVYAPQFGGHAAMSLAQGYLSDGNAQLYLLIAKRLYLFYSPSTRKAFSAAPGPAITSARAHWHELSQQFSALPATAPAPTVVASVAAAPPGP